MRQIAKLTREQHKEQARHPHEDVIDEEPTLSELTKYAKQKYRKFVTVRQALLARKVVDKYCPVCHNVYRSRSNVVRHLFDSHTGEPI